MKVVQAKPGPWLDFAYSGGRPQSWYERVRQAGYVGVGLDLFDPEGEAALQRALASGLQVQVYQGWWGPAWSGGVRAAQQRAREAARIGVEWGLPKGMRIWLDSESWPFIPATDVMAWINAWTEEIEAVGYKAGLYVGYRTPLTADELYYGLKLDRYWRSASQVPDVAVRGYCMVQEQVNVKVEGAWVDIDRVQPDQKGDLPEAVVLPDTAGSLTEQAAVEQELAEAARLIAEAEARLKGAAS